MNPGSWIHTSHHGLCNPEATTLRKDIFKSIAWELMLFRQVRMGQGTLFMSKQMQNLCQLLQVRQLHTVIYHPQTDGLWSSSTRSLDACSTRYLMRLVTTGTPYLPLCAVCCPRDSPDIHQFYTIWTALWATSLGPAKCGLGGAAIILPLRGRVCLGNAEENWPGSASEWVGPVYYWITCSSPVNIHPSSYTI